MARKCCVLSCEEVVREARAKGLPFHKFPKDATLRSRWLTSGGFPPDFRPTPGQIVCHRHFRRADYEVVKGHKFLLKRGTVPSVFADYDNHPDPMSKLVQKRTSYPQEDLDLINSKILNLSEAIVKSEVSNHETATTSNLQSESLPNCLNLRPDEICNVVSRVESIKEEPLSSATGEVIVAVKEEIVDNENTMNPLTSQLDMLGSQVKPGASTKTYNIKEELENVQLNQDTKIEKCSDLKPKVINRGGLNFVTGTRLEAKDFNDKWFPARIVETDWVEQEVLIHFDKWSSRYDEWIPMDSSRLRELQVQPSEQTWALPSPDTRMREFVVGEKILATWGDGRKYPARVKAVLGNDRYDVLFDDGYPKIVKSSKMTKVAESSVKNTIEGESYIGSKQERRDKKRKHIVMELFQTHSKKKSKAEGEKPAKKDEPVANDEEKDLLKSDLDASILGALGDNSMDVLRGFENSTPPRNRTYSKKAKKEAKTDAEFDDTAPEWVDGEPLGVESFIVEGTDGPRRSIIVPDKKLPPGWQKHFTQRRAGTSAGKWDVLFIHKASGKKFRSRNDIRAFMENQGQFDFDPDMFDFCIHRKKRSTKVKAEVDGTKKIKTLLPKTKSVTSTPEPLYPAAVSSPVSCSMGTPTLPIEDGAVFIGGLRVEMEDSAYKCPKEGCNKNFRKENLLQMHIKHYHPEYSKFLGSTPNVADLAYARTIGESIDDIIPKKANNFLDKINKIEKRKSGVHEKSQLIQNSSLNQLVPSYMASMTPPQESDDRGHQYMSLSGDDGKLEAKSPLLSNGVNSEEYCGPKRDNSCAMSPGTLFDMRAKDEKMPTGIKTLLPVRPPVVNDQQRPDRSKSLDDSLHGDKGRSHRKRQLSDQSGDLTGKNRRRQSDIGEECGDFDDSTLDAEGPAGLMYRYSRRKSDTRSDENSQNKSESGMIMVNGEMVKVEKLRREEIINCTCGYVEEDGLMIQCDLCLCWQHGHCNGIEKEKDVPEKYTCYTCQHSFRQRASKKYTHDQEWLKEGKLPSLSDRTKNQLLINQRTAMLKRSSDLIAALLGIQNVLHCLRVKINVAQKKDHPKLYLWAKNWEKTEIPKPDVEPVPAMEIVKTWKLKKSNDAETEASHSVDNKFTDLELAKALKDNVDGKSITSAKELMKILEEDNSMHSDESKMAFKTEDTENPTDGHILLDALTKTSCNDDLNLQESKIFPKIENDLSIQSDPSSQTPAPLAEQLKLEPASMHNEPEVTIPTQPFIPEPEAPIDPEECKLRLLEHIEHFQNHIESRLTAIEAQINVLEDMDPDLMPGPDLHSKTTKTIEMLLRDLSTVRKLAALS